MFCFEERILGKALFKRRFVEKRFCFVSLLKVLKALCCKKNKEYFEFVFKFENL